MTDVMSLPTANTPHTETRGVLPPATRNGGDSDDVGLRASAFFFAWSAYLFLHHTMVYYAWFRLKDARGDRDIEGLLIGAFVWLLGGAALLRGTLPWFTALLVGNLIYELPALPKTANHTFLTICMNVTMLAAIAAHAIRSRGRGFEESTPLFPKLAALLRLEVLAMYFFVVLHKLNVDYFNPAYSCATQLYADIVKDYPFFPSGAWTDPLCIYGALAAEAAIPLLLLFRRTRLWGVGLGLLFHFMLSPHPNRFIFSFSALLYAAYFLFIPRDVLAEMAAIWGRMLSRLRDRWLWFALAAAGAASAIVLLRLLTPQFVKDMRIIDHAHVYLSAGIRLAWMLLALFNMYAFGRAMWICRRPESRRDDQANDAEPLFRPAFTTPLLIFPLLVGFNGFCPYLGLKTESAFAMYANLRTEGWRNNHLFMPRIDLANYQADLVEIVDSNDRGLRKLKRQGNGWTWFEFRRNKLSKIKSEKFYVTYRRNGVETTLRYAEHKNDPAFGPVSWVEKRLLYFRDVQVAASPQQCGH